MIEENKLLAGRYRLVEMIDSGGTAHIYRATDEISGQTVAVKILKPELTQNEEFVQRFKKEVQASLKLRHANIIRGYDAGLDDGMYYIVMELIEGKTLKQLIQLNGSLPVNYIVNVVKKMCLALEYAHVKGFIHRDIKPHNVMVDTTGEPYIADFGIAKNLEANTITVEDNSVMGSVHYFSPEQARGERADKRSDLYSLGIMMYEMLTGEVPFDGDTSVAIALKHINEEMPDIDEEVYELPASIKKIILKATQKDKHFRYKSAFAMYEDLQRCLSEPDGEYIKYTESKRAQQYVDESHLRRSRKHVNKVFVVIGVGVAVVAALVALIAFAINGNRDREFEVPAVEGMDEVKAAELLDTGHFVPEIVYEQSEQPMGIVIRQDPGEGTVIGEGSVIRLFVSKGLETGIMPNITDIPLEQAEEQLRVNGLEVTEIERSVEGESSIGFVMEQTPAAGEPIAAGDEIRLLVKISPDENKVRVPQVMGMDVADALDDLKAVGFEIFFIKEGEMIVTPGRVNAQAPEQDTEHPVDQPVALEVSRFHENDYSFEGDIEIDVPEDMTTVTIAISDTIGDTEVYYVISESVEAEGKIDKMIQATLVFDATDESINKQMMIFFNGSPETSRGVKFTKVVDED